MRTVKGKGKIIYEPTSLKECEYLLCANCSLFGTSSCLVCKGSQSEIKALKKENAKLKKQIKKLKEAQ
jgi:hypothetical protein